MVPGHWMQGMGNVSVEPGARSAPKDRRRVAIIFGPIRSRRPMPRPLRHHSDRGLIFRLTPSRRQAAPEGGGSNSRPQPWQDRATSNRLTKLVISWFSRSRKSAQTERRRGSRVNYQIFSFRQPGAHLDYAYYHMYTLNVVFAWDEPKRQANLASTGSTLRMPKKCSPDPWCCSKTIEPITVNSA